MARRYSRKYGFVHGMTVQMTDAQRTGVLRLAERAQASASLILRQAVNEKLARELPADEVEGKRAAK